MEKAATVAQLVGVDARGLIRMIVHAVETVRRNKKECRKLCKRVRIIGNLLQYLMDDEAGSVLMKEPATRNPIEELEETLRDAYTLVVECQQESNVVCLLCRASRTAGRLREVQENIMFYLVVFPIVSHVHTVCISQQIQDVDPPPPLPSMFVPQSETAAIQEATDDQNLDGILQPENTVGMGTQGYSVGGGIDQAARPARRKKFQVKCAVVRVDVLERVKDAVTGSDGLAEFKFSQMADATNNFSLENRIAKSSFATVYKGRLHHDGVEVAIKRFSRREYFLDELTIVSKLDEHVNIIKRIGYYVEGSRCLVYEYMPNGSLCDILSGKSIDWQSRRKIIEGIAEGVVYLHKHKPCIVHRNLKPSNILLDSEMNPKIADFRVAKILCPDGDEEAVDLVGTLGYIAPEYILEGAISVKIDIYSFGVILLEIISGRSLKPISTSVGFNPMITTAWSSWRRGKFSEFIDISLQNSINDASRKEMKRYIQIALLCIQEKPEDRPTMPDILEMLNTKKAIKLAIPKQPLYTKDTKATYYGHI